jgi:hypothetical protein
MINKDWAFKVIESNVTTFKAGDIVKPVRVFNGRWLIGFDYRRSLHFDQKDKVTFECFSSITPGKLLVRIERIK